MNHKWPNIIDLDFSKRIPLMKRKISLLFSIASYFGYQIRIDRYENSNSIIRWNAYLVAKNPNVEDFPVIQTILLNESGFRNSKEKALVKLFLSLSYTNCITRSVRNGVDFKLIDFSWIEYAPSHEEDLDKLELDLVLMGAIQKNIQFKFIQENARSPFIMI